MAEIRVPFCATAELAPPFTLDETYSEPNGVKSVLFDTSSLKIACRVEAVDVPGIGEVSVGIYHLMGTISYICNAFPVVRSKETHNIEQQTAAFNADLGNEASACVVPSASAPQGWVSTAGYVTVNAPVGGSCNMEKPPVVEEVSVDDLAVSVNTSGELAPTCIDSCGEEEKHVVKWRGCFVIKTGSEKTQA
jgi:hypothetical protein